MSSSNSSLPFHLNADLWFDDRDIFVCARRFDSGALCLYKLYRDIVAAHSSIILSLLDTSLAGGHVYIDNTPYAYLADHDTLDLELFFFALYYLVDIFFWKTNARSFSCALPVFEIALKYKANDVIEALARQLEPDWPNTISEWDSACEDDPCFQLFGDLHSENRSLKRDAATEAASAIQVAHIANMPNVLPIASYQLSRINPSDIWWQDTGSQLGPTEDCNWETERPKRDHGGGKSDRRMLLWKDDLRCITLGKEKLSRYMLSFKKRLSKELVLHPRCADAWNISVPIKSEDALTDLLELCNVKVCSGVDMCSDCRSQINERGREECARVWALLPRLFCLLVHHGKYAFMRSSRN